MPAVGSGRRAHDSPSSVRRAIRKSSFSTTSVARTDAALEDGRVLEHRRLDLAIAVAPGKRRGDRLEAPERGTLVGQEVAGAARGAIGWASPEVY